MINGRLFKTTSKSAFLAIIMTCAPFIQILPAQARWVLDDFEDGNLESSLEWMWEVFAANQATTIRLQVEADETENSRLIASGTLPGAETGFTYGGLLCAPEDHGEGATEPKDFTGFYALSFRGASDRPGYYTVRLEQKKLGHNSTNVVFPVTNQMQEFIVPLSEFRSGVSETTAIAFTRLVDTPGAAFHLELDDVGLEPEAPKQKDTRRLESIGEWAPSPEIAWQNAQFHNKPLLCYFSSKIATPCRQFEKRLVNYKQFGPLAQEFVLTRLDVDEHQSVTRRYNVWKVPTFTVFEPVSGRSTTLYTGSDVNTLGKAMRTYLEERPEKDLQADQNTSPAERYQIVWIDDFSDRNDLNDVGGRWGAFSYGDQGDIASRFTDLGSGNLAMEIKGTYPGRYGQPTWGGVYCDITPDRTTPRNLSNYRWISFICRSSASSVFQIHLEAGPQQRSEPMQFHVSEEPRRVTLPLSSFGDFTKSVTSLVWSQPEPRVGMEFHLVLDDVMVIR